MLQAVLHKWFLIQIPRLVNLKNLDIGLKNGKLAVLNTTVSII